ncbi:MAG: transglutaminase domain-containing protein, partial [FCB group bacterium]|nr:transglutaminase domain-containing protein [FCB group bacterium]
WRTKPWAKKLTFKQFCNYVLPYRGSNEPLEPWRKEFWDKYQNLTTKMTDTSNPIEAASLINDDVKSWFTFDPRFYYHPTDQGLPEMMKNKMGRCEDMTNLAIYAMRANGLAVTSDYTPYWANHGNNHAWNAIVTLDGKVIPFMGAESNPGEYHLPFKMAKVYRKTYNEQKQNLIFQKRKQKKVPRWLAGKSYLDVTVAYTKVCNVTVNFDQEIPDSVDIAYLCVFNSGEWKAINWGRIENGTAVFEDMGADIAYLPALYLNEKIVPYAPPFILKNDCQLVKLASRQQHLEAVSLISTNPYKRPKATDSTIKSYLKPEQKYELFYWQDGWQSLGEKVAQKDKPLVFEKVPSDGLYWLVADSSDKEERIFTIDKSKQVWW